MVKRFQPDLTKARAGIRTFDRGEYEVEITDVRPIAYTKEATAKEKEKDVAGGRVIMKMVGQVSANGKLNREFEGESIRPNRLYVHTDGAWGITKRFIMAALGYNLDNEDKFDADWASKADISVEGEGDAAVLGKSWMDLKGQHLIVTLDKDTYKGREQQTIGSPLPMPK